MKMKHPHPPQLSLLLLLLLLLSQLPPGVEGSEGVAASLCLEVRGFASEHHDRLTIAVPAAPAGGHEAIVLVARAFPLALGDLAQRWLQLNASYRLRAGPSVSALSNDDGIVVITDVAGGTNIDVEVNRVRRDGPVPFRFWSYYANRPVCHIDVSPDNAFMAPIPIRVSEVASPAKIFFKSIAPKDAKGVMVQIETNIPSGITPNFQVMTSPTLENGVSHSSGDLIPWSENVLYFVYTPDIVVSRNVLLRVNVVWTDDITEGKVVGNNTITTQQPQGGENPSLSPVGPSTNYTGTNKSLNDTKTTTEKGRSTGSYIFIIIFCIVLYFLVMSAVNYRLKGVREFPEMIPHIDVFRSCSQYLSLVKDSYRQGNMRGGYRDLNREEVSTENI